MDLRSGRDQNRGGLQLSLAGGSQVQGVHSAENLVGGLDCNRMFQWGGKDLDMISGLEPAR